MGLHRAGMTSQLALGMQPAHASPCGRTAPMHGPCRTQRRQVAGGLRPPSTRLSGVANPSVTGMRAPPPQTSTTPHQALLGGGHPPPCPAHRASCAPCPTPSCTWPRNTHHRSQPPHGLHASSERVLRLVQAPPQHRTCGFQRHRAALGLNPLLVCGCVCGTARPAQRCSSLFKTGRGSYARGRCWLVEDEAWIKSHHCYGGVHAHTHMHVYPLPPPPLRWCTPGTQRPLPLLVSVGPAWT